MQKIRGKKYCILIFLKNPKKVKPFQINKKGFGAMASWITVKNIHEIQYQFLVRDNIPDYIKSKGGNAIFHVADEKEYWLKLKEKLSEEVSEFLEAESIEEMADVLEVIDAIFDYKKFDKQEVQKVKDKKASERGEFKIR